MQSTYDVLVIGAGHNGLICATRLAQAGYSVCVVEQRLEAGGGLSTEEISIYGVWHNLHSLYHETLPDSVAFRELALDSFGVRYLLPEVQAAVADVQESSWALYADPAQTIASIRRISPEDAATWQRLYERFRPLVSDVVLPGLYEGSESESLSERLRGLPGGGEFLRYAVASPRQVVEELFVHPEVQGLVLRLLAIPKGVLPDYPGRGDAVLRVVAGAEPARMVEGGTHVLAQALVRALARAGGHVFAMAGVTEILVQDGRAVGIRLRDGRQMTAQLAVVSAVDVGQTLQELLPSSAVDTGWSGSASAPAPDDFAVFSVHLALKEPIRYRNDAANGAAKVFIGSNRTDSYLQTVQAIGRGELPAPAMLAATPTAFDASQSALGLHAALAWQLAPKRLAEGTWAQYKELYAHQLLEAWRAVAVNLNPENILRVVAMTPDELLDRYPNMQRTGMFGGRMTGERSGIAPGGGASHRTPIPGLYLAGASTYPGGGVTGAPGFRAASAVLEDIAQKPL